MDGLSIAMQIQQNAELAYPHLSPQAAVLQYSRDIYELVPEVIRSNLPSIATIRSRLPDIGVATARLAGARYMFPAEIARIFSSRGIDVKTEEFHSSVIALAQRRNELLENIQDQLNTFHQPDIFGQLSAFSTSAAAVYQIKRLADQAERMANSLRGIESLLRSEHTRGQHFPRHVHSYIRLLIEKNATDSVSHYFSVFNHNDLWYPEFADIQRQDPLGPFYLGHRTDLDELCAFLANEVRPQIGPEAVLHIVMPSIGPLSLEEAIKFPEAMRPFKIDGQIGTGGVKLVYICAPEVQDQECLDGVGLLKQREVWKIVGGIGIPFTSIGIGSEQYFIDPTWRVTTDVGLIFGGSCYYYCGLEPPRTLGQPTVRPWY